MKLSTFKYLLSALVVLLALFPQSVKSGDNTLSMYTLPAPTLQIDQSAFKQEETTVSRYERITRRYQNFWRSLIPNQIKLQYAGSIGLVSASAGWHYGHAKRVWETDLYFGFLPKYSSRHDHATMTLKQSYVPFRITINEGFQIEPLACGLFFNTIFGDEFWNSQPDKYPKHYYGFPTKIRANVFLGQRLRFPIPSEKRHHANCISFYYELSTCDLYLASYVTNNFISLTDILSLSFGLKFDLF